MSQGSGALARTAGTRPQGTQTPEGRQGTPAARKGCTLGLADTALLGILGTAAGHTRRQRAVLLTACCPPCRRRRPRQNCSLPDSPGCCDPQPAVHPLLMPSAPLCAHVRTLQRDVPLRDIHRANVPLHHRAAHAPTECYTLTRVHHVPSISKLHEAKEGVIVRLPATRNTQLKRNLALDIAVP